MKKRLIMVMCCGIMILGNLSGCNAMKTKETEYHWPTSTLVKSLPVPESKYGEIVLMQKILLKLTFLIRRNHSLQII